MPMKSTAVTSTSLHMDYPKLMTTADGAVVLFWESEEGILVQEGTISKRPVGYYTNSWDMACFEDYEGSITLENSYA